MVPLDFPQPVLDVFEHFYTCEFSTIAKDGTPLAWPVSSLYKPETGMFMLTTSIGLPQKAYNIRRNPKVAMLFSEPTASGLSSPPAVLVQGEAQAPDEIVTSVKQYRKYWVERIMGRQPDSKQMSSHIIMRYLADWYYMRIIMTVTPRRVLWWDDGDFSRTPHVKGPVHVA